VIHGLVEPGFGDVAKALGANLERRGDVGAACCVYLDGKPVVDIWAGFADAASMRPWQDDTLAVVFSTTKGATAVCANLLIERGLLDPNMTVADVWPEFAVNGKEAIPLRAVLSHRAGLPVVEGDFTLDSALAWDPVVDQLARQAPRWSWEEPAPGYHIRSYGWLTGEIVRRVTGQTLGQFFEKEVAGPLGLDWWIGLPEGEEPRVATLRRRPRPKIPELRELMEVFTAGNDDRRRASGPSNLFTTTRCVEHPPAAPLRAAVVERHRRRPRIARMWAAGHRLRRRRSPPPFSPATVARGAGSNPGPDRIPGLPMQFGLGFALGPSLPPACGPAAFGHPGAGGSLGFADADQRVGFGYVMNQMQLGITGDARSEVLVRAVYAALGK
jgi:CubicO group peptidase (beta-lactamase class C family)